ncbi:helix-turn-helix domain-containing protein [Paenibacillus lemnae]|uniref:Helix-turn-helix transcriptional regulator n=1 Tax=Paenibacillus lemnae TaxID=1330551 RepID=A0A848M5A9_PAELE|nr:helix-turn-helix transcriptional regulator [Paenibacillus lemnae]NMO95786.1 helix-turn-helix transcriptional regulator [Paenibacillus lemnae]
MYSIYQRIEQLIESRGMTKKAFCEQLGISTGNFGDWKRGKTTPSTSKLVEISSFFSVSLDWLIVGRGNPSSSIMEIREDYSMNEGGEQSRTSTLTDEEKQFIQEYVEFTEYRKMKKNKH